MMRGPTSDAGAGGSDRNLAPLRHHARVTIRVLGHPLVGETLIASPVGLTKSAECTFFWSRKRYICFAANHSPVPYQNPKA